MQELVSPPAKRPNADLTAVAGLEPHQGNNPGNPEQTRQNEILQRAKARFRKAMEADDNDRQEALLDLRFYVGQQWDDGVKNERFNAGRPMLTIDRIRAQGGRIESEQVLEDGSIQLAMVAGY